MVQKGSLRKYTVLFKIMKYLIKDVTTEQRETQQNTDIFYACMNILAVHQ